MSPDRMESAQEWLTSMNRAHKSRPVTYVRGKQEKVVPAVIGKSFFKADSGYGLFTRVESRDYFIEVGDLADFGEPARGDRVKDTLSGKVEIFEVMAPNGEDHFSTDAFKKVFRIHVKHVGTESA